MADGEDRFDYMKQSVYPKSYMHKFPLPNEGRNPLAGVVPLEADDFFAPTVCNVIVLTGNFDDFDTSAVSACQARLRVCYPFFTKYETHFVVDESSDNVACMTDDQKNDLDTRLNELVAPVADLNVTYHGRLQGQELNRLLDDIMKAFFKPDPPP